MAGTVLHWPTFGSLTSPHSVVERHASFCRFFRHLLLPASQTLPFAPVATQPPSLPLAVGSSHQPSELPSASSTVLPAHEHSTHWCAVAPVSEQSLLAGQSASASQPATHLLFSHCAPL